MPYHPSNVLACLLAISLSLPAGAAPQSSDGQWARLKDLPRGRRLGITSGGNVYVAALVAADATSLLVLDLTHLPDERARRAVEGAVRARDGKPLTEGAFEAKGHEVPVVRFDQDNVSEVTMTTTRGSKTTTGLATFGAALGGLFLGAWAGIATNGGMFAEEQGGTVVAILIAVAVPVTVGGLVHAATSRTETVVVYSDASRGTKLDDADWRAVRDALPASLRR